ncbi:beta-glucosidase [Exophiala xenobiotica]|nr:beta-glucosidase [Exophiala xenobiotica]
MDVEDILARLTIDEKVSLLSGVDFWHTSAVPRLNIPSLRMTDGPNGARGSRLFNGTRAACFPCGTGMAATWDVDLIRSCGKAMGQEAIAKRASILLGPTVNIQRSPLGGRGFESFSEDPVLAGYMAAASVAGIQETGVVAAIKHFVGNDQEEFRQRSNSVIGARALREVYLLPFQIAQRDASPKAYMTAYNRINGVHVSENPILLQAILRDEWGFDGVIVSDWYGTYSVAESMRAGLDIEMPGPTRWRGFLAKLSLNAGKLSESTLDDRVRAVLKTVDRVASLNIPCNAPEGDIAGPATSQKLRTVASSGIVLLKNDRGLLPLRKDKTTAVIGPNAKFAAYSGGGSASLRPYYTVTPYEGIYAQAEHVQYALGAVGHKKLPMLASQTTAPDGQRGMQMRVYLEPHGVPNRKPVDSFNITESDCPLNDYQHPEIHTNLFYVEVEAFLTPEISGLSDFSLTVNGTGCLFVDGALVVDNETVQRPGESFFGSGTAEEKGTIHLDKGKRYQVLVQFTTAPSSKLRVSGATQMGVGGLQIGGCPRYDAAALLSEAVSLAKQVDQVVLCVGLNGEWESEGWDRQTMDLPPGNDVLVERIVAVNPNVVVVNQSGTPVAMPWASKVPAILQAWYGGNETGNAIADVLFGAVNPSGKLPLSWPVRVEDNPAYINTRNDDGDVCYGEGLYVGHRWYEKTNKQVLFPFGHGLSYTAFDITSCVADSDSETLAVSVDVSNTGSRAGAEVLQVYVSQRTPSVPRPLKELKGFKKVQLDAGERQTVQIRIDLRYACSFWSQSRSSWMMEKGVYGVLVGTSSQCMVGKADFEVKSTKLWKGL